jgi:ABC-2 type transport system ATP-binding protein
MNSDYVLEMSQLSKSFGAVQAVKGLSLNIGKGEIFGFLGPNGAGKTTTIRMITGLVHPDGGQIKIGGHDIGKRFFDAICSVGTLMENPAFYPYLSAAENLQLLSQLTRMDKAEAGGQIIELLNLVKLSENSQKPVKGFSQGMRQRLGIAAALLGRPEVIILDEPTNGLDPSGINEMRQLIKEIAEERNITVFLSSHMLKEVEQICTRVGIINQGQLVAEGDIESLLKGDKDVHTLEEYFLKYTNDRG